MSPFTPPSSTTVSPASPARRDRTRRRRAVSAACQLETLELRRLLSFQIHGTDAPDNFIINVQSDNRIHVTFNGGVEVFDAPSDGFVGVLGFGGDDTIWLQNTGNLRFTLSGFAGNDTFRVGNGVLERDLKRDVHIVELPTQPGPPAHGGNDTIIIDDSISSGGTTYVARKTELLVASSPSQPIISWIKQPEDSVKLVGSIEKDILFAEGLPQNSVFDMGDGNDTVVLGVPDKIVPTDLPDNATIEDGGGFDELVIDDSNPNSPRTRMDFDDTGLVGSVNFSGFHKMEVRTHVVGGELPEPVTFRGRTCPAFFVTLVGTDGPDLVQFGTPEHPIDIAELYVEDVTLKLKTGSNKLEVDESADANGHSWKLIDNKLETGIMTINNPLPTSGPAGVVDVLVKGTRNADRFLVARSSLLWNVTFDGRAGDDAFEQAPLLLPGTTGRYDLDDFFVGYVKFDGNAGVDSVILNDSEDQTGDADHYTITARGLRKGDFQEPDDFALEYSFIDRLTVVCDDDANTIFYDASGLDVADIFGGGGTDTFINRSDATQLPVFANSLAALTRLHGGDGNDILALDDTSGGAGNYDLSATDLAYTRQSGTLRVQFDDFSTVNVAGSNQANTAVIRAKPQAETFSFTGNGGDDTLVVGGGDIDASGLNNVTLLGGTGQDHIVFDDRADDHGPADEDKFDFYLQQVKKDGNTILYGGFESQKLITSGVNTSGTAFPSRVRVNAIDIPTEIEGTAGTRDNVVDIGNGSVAQIFAPVTLSFADAPVVASVFDLSTLTGRTFEVSATRMSLPITVNYVGVEEMYVYAGSGNDTLNANGTPAGMSLVFNGGDGDDTMNVGSGAGAIADLAGRVFAHGGNGTDRVFFTNGTGGGFTEGVLTGGSFRANGGPNHLYSALEQVQVMLNDDGANVNVTSLSASTGIQGGGGDDRVTVGGGDLDVNILSNLFVRGAGGNDRVVFDDRNGTNQPGTPTEYRFDVFNGAAGAVDRFFASPAGSASFFVSCLDVEQRQFDASDDANFINVLDTTHDLRINAFGGSDTISVTDATGLVTLDTGAGDDAVTVNADAAAPGDAPLTVLFDRSDDVHALDLRAGGTLRVGPDAVLLKTGGALALDGTLDLAGGAMLFRGGANAPSQATLRAKLSAGRNGGAWNGTSATGAIHSSRAAATPIGDGVGYGLGSDLGLSTIGSFTIDPGDMLVRYALNGDANLNGTVSLADFNRLAGAFGQSPRAWTDGDFNYDGAVDLRDFNLLAANFGQAPGAPAAAGGSAATLTGRVAAAHDLAELD